MSIFEKYLSLKKKLKKISIMTLKSPDLTPPFQNIPLEKISDPMPVLRILLTGMIKVAPYPHISVNINSVFLSISLHKKTLHLHFLIF